MEFASNLLACIAANRHDIALQSGAGKLDDVTLD